MDPEQLHPLKEDLLLFAAAADPTLVRYRQVAHHLGTGCDACSRWLDRYRQVSAPLPWQDLEPKAPAGWQRPVRVECLSAQNGAVLVEVVLACGSGLHEVDVRVLETGRPRTVEIAGQVTAGGRIEAPVVGSSVCLIGPNGAVGQAAETDTAGRFRLAGPPEAYLGLSVGEGAGAPVVLVWEDRLW